jgi:hypothetical protein
MLSLEYRCNPFVQIVLYGDGLVLNFVVVVTTADGPDCLVSNLVPVAESGGDAAQ